MTARHDLEHDDPRAVEVRALTESMAEHQRAVLEAGQRRRQLLAELLPMYSPSAISRATGIARRVLYDACPDAVAARRSPSTDQTTERPMP